MVTSDVRVQTAVHSLDQGRLGTLIKVAMFGALIVCLSLLYLFVQFRGLSTADAMDQAQISRRLADGKGFTTDYIRSLALSIIQRQTGKEQVDVSMFPDFFQAPLHPWVSSLGMRLIKEHWKMGPADVVYKGDRVVAALSMVSFLLSVAIWYLVFARLFDSRLALIGSAALLLTDLMWQFSLAALPQMLVLFLFSLATLCTLYAIEARDRGIRLVILWLIAAGACLGLMTLAHGLAVWIFAGWLIFAFAYFTPRGIGAVAAWFKEDEMICSDMPWAIALYAQRSSLLLPVSIRAFNAIHDYQRTVQPIRGLYLTPVTGAQPLFSGIYAGAYKDWAPLITRPPQVRGFPFTAFVPLPIDRQCIIFSDRPRWNQPRTAVP
ncbi:MAG: hypothetical protein WCC08_08670 [Terrimicrobiaceae bacterium]